MTLQRVNVAERFSRIDDHWHPRIVGELNGQAVKAVKLLGDFVWHHHAEEDELFLVTHGAFTLDWRDGSGVVQSVTVSEGEFVIVPRGVEHRPRADREAHVLLFEPAATLNTGNVRNSRTIEKLEVMR